MYSWKSVNALPKSAVFNDINIGPVCWLSFLNVFFESLYL